MKAESPAVTTSVTMFSFCSFCTTSRRRTRRSVTSLAMTITRLTTPSL